jgi:radical SAM superfamily enzyme YgiQ (UPF0313 family)
MKILLIKPAWFSHGIFINCHLSRVPPLNLGILATLSDGHNVTIADDDVEDIPYSSEWDLVGISVATSTAIDAYNIADKFRNLGTKVILGGVHPSILPQEALNHADSVLIGEAEKMWLMVLSDFPRLKSIYEETGPVDMDEVPEPRRDLFHSSYISAPVQMTRGCVYKCDYCYLQNVSWKTYRKRSAEKVAKEISQIKQKFLFVIDDNLFVDMDYVLDVAQRIQPFKKFWVAQAPISVGKDRNIVKKLSSSGLCGVSLGIDSVIKDSLNSVSKLQNELEDVKQVVKNLHDHGIAVSSFFVFGFEHDGLDIFNKSIELIHEMNIDSGVFFVLTPYPGTDLFKRLDQEKRILTKDWSKYNWMHSVFIPKNISSEELETGTLSMYRMTRDKKLTHFYNMLPIAFRLMLRSPRLAWNMKDYLFM